MYFFLKTKKHVFYIKNTYYINFFIYYYALLFLFKIYKKKRINFLQKNFAKKKFFSKSEQMRKNTDNKFYI